LTICSATAYAEKPFPDESGKLPAQLFTGKFDLTGDGEKQNYLGEVKN
jgi:hypothetical protein